MKTPETSTRDITCSVGKSTTGPAPATSAYVERRPSLKRKRVQDDQDGAATSGYPHNLALIYPPKKRSRTPTSEGDTQEVQDLKSTSLSTPDGELLETATQDATSESPQPIPPSTPKLAARIIADEPKTPPAFGSSAFVTSPLMRTTPGPRVITSNAFAAFAGSTSPFASLTSSQSLSKNSRPAWTSPSKDVAVCSTHLNEAPSTTTAAENDLYTTSSAVKSHNALEAAPVSNTTPTVKSSTGEENEDVELELKAVKLFVKRAQRPFSDGVTGHIKLLSNKSTLDERLLFRREPLWQVSMNIRLHPSMRCVLDEEDKVLRIITKEAIGQSEASQDDPNLEVVVYALKPGRSCSKRDFFDFANSLMESPGLKAR